MIFLFIGCVGGLIGYTVGTALHNLYFQKEDKGWGDEED